MVRTSLSTECQVPSVAKRWQQDESAQIWLVFGVFFTVRTEISAMTE
jgi:hypothetical protein